MSAVSLPMLALKEWQPSSLGEAGRSILRPATLPSRKFSCLKQRVSLRQYEAKTQCSVLRLQARRSHARREKRREKKATSKSRRERQDKSAIRCVYFFGGNGILPTQPSG